MSENRVNQYSCSCGQVYTTVEEHIRSGGLVIRPTERQRATT